MPPALVEWRHSQKEMIDNFIGPVAFELAPLYLKSVTVSELQRLEANVKHEDELTLMVFSGRIPAVLATIRAAKTAPLDEVKRVIAWSRANRGKGNQTDQEQTALEEALFDGCREEVGQEARKEFLSTLPALAVLETGGGDGGGESTQVALGNA